MLYDVAEWAAYWQLSFCRQGKTTDMRSISVVSPSSGGSRYQIVISSDNKHRLMPTNCHQASHTVPLGTSDSPKSIKAYKWPRVTTPENTESKHLNSAFPTFSADHRHQ
ncbi:hypothetical protein TNCV_1729951 [Trichonephila clavipes]|nr:hypothetical protein TNCV_1729951 [Trichonephila clavipes]